MSGPRPTATGRTVTLQDVALAADVAVSTVSRALSNPDRVSRTTREHVQAIARELGYLPNRPTTRTRLLALLIGDIGNPHNAGLIRGAEAQIRAAGWSLVLGDIQDGAEVESAHIERLTDSADAFILAGSRLPAADLRAVQARGPVVLFNREVDGFPGLVTDSVDGSRQIIEHLAALGHRSIAYLGGPPALWSEAERWRGLSTAAGSAGLHIVRLGPFLPTLDQGTAAADVGLASGATALVAFNDLLAIGALLRLDRRGVDVPDAISLVGFDDIFGAEFCRPALTTVNSPVELAGRTLVDLALGRVSSRPGGTLRLPTRLVVRDSTGPVAG